MAEEYLDICDEHGMPTGQTMLRSTAHSQGLRHRTAHVWIAKTETDAVHVLMQRRSACKDSFPGYWDTSSAGHIPAGSEPVSSALRELEEELGIRAQPGDLVPIGEIDVAYDKIFHNAMFKDREHVFLYVYTRPVDIGMLKLQEEEIGEVRWFPLDTLAADKLDPARMICAPLAGIQTVAAYFSHKRP